MPNMTHWGLSISIGRASSSSSSGKTGASLSTVVNRLTVETVTRSRNAVSTSEHLLTGLQCRIEVPRGIRMAARAQSTMAWWKRRPWLHLRWKCFLLWLMMTVQQLIDDIWIFKHDGTGLSKFETAGCHCLPACADLLPTPIWYTQRACQRIYWKKQLFLN